MPTEADLLAAIDASPADDAPRLAHADWVEKNDDPQRARFIRLQLEHSRMLGLAPNGRPLTDSLALLRDNEARWLAGWPRHSNLQWRFERGYPELVTFHSLAAWRETWREVFARPVRRVHIAAGKDMGRLANEPGLEHVRGLEWSCDEEGLLAVLASPHLKRLSALICKDVRSSLVVSLARNPALAGLRYLELISRPSVPLDGACLGALALSPHLAGLRELRLVGLVEDAGIAALGLPGALPALEALRLHRLNPGRAAWEGLAAEGALPSLKSLAAGEGPFGALAAEAVARARHWALRHLDLPLAEVADPGAKALAGASQLRNLVRLTLWGSRITDEGAIALAGSPHLGSLEWLSLRSNLVGEAGARALGRSTALAALRRLDMEECPAPPSTRQAVERRFREGLPPLREERAPVVLATPLPSAPAVGKAEEDGLVRAILADPWDEVARSVYADWLEEQGRPHHAALLRASGRERQAALAAVEKDMAPGAPCKFDVSLTAEGLVRVSVTTRALRSKAFERDGPAWLRRHHVAEVMPSGESKSWKDIFHGPAMAHIRGLRLASDVGVPELEALASSPHLAGLASLDLHAIHRNGENNLHVLFGGAKEWGLCRLRSTGGGLGAPRMRQLGEAPFAPHLRNLTVGMAFSALDTLAELADCPSLSGLVTLSAEGGHLYDAAVLALANARHLVALRNLELVNCWLGEEAYRGLVASPVFQGLRRLRVVTGQVGLGGLARAVAATPHCRLSVPKATDELQDILGERLIVE